MAGTARVTFTRTTSPFPDRLLLFTRGVPGLRRPPWAGSSAGTPRQSPVGGITRFKEATKPHIADGRWTLLMWRHADRSHIAGTGRGQPGPPLSLQLAHAYYAAAITVSEALGVARERRARPAARLAGRLPGPRPSRTRDPDRLARTVSSAARAAGRRGLVMVRHRYRFRFPGAAISSRTAANPTRAARPPRHRHGGPPGACRPRRGRGRSRRRASSANVPRGRRR